MSTAISFRLFFLSLCVWCYGAVIPTSVFARGEILGIHILSPAELEKADELLARNDDKDQFVTVPLTLSDLEKKDAWQQFFDRAHERRLRPIIRFSTTFENGSWKKPTRADVVHMTTFLSSLSWHRPDMTVVLFNEPNHAKEWNGVIHPQEFADMSVFASRWLKTERKNYIVLPAGLDLAAPNGKETMEAFTYWDHVFAHAPNFLDHFDGWTSHSYPNPGFSSSPQRTDKMSLRGYQHELAYIRKYTDRELPVYITETGWSTAGIREKNLYAYYKTAFESIWRNDERVVAVTPFLLQGAPGIFTPFSFLDKDGRPTVAYDAYRAVLAGTN